MGKDTLDKCYELLSVNYFFLINCSLLILHLILEVILYIINVVWLQSWHFTNKGFDVSNNLIQAKTIQEKLSFSFLQKQTKRASLLLTGLSQWIQLCLWLVDFFPVVQFETYSLCCSKQRGSLLINYPDKQWINVPKATDQSKDSICDTFEAELVKGTMQNDTMYAA